MDPRDNIDFFQDDIPLCTGPDDRDIHSRATQQLVGFLGQYSFSVQPNKVIISSQDIEFSGDKLTRDVTQPPFT